MQIDINNVLIVSQKIKMNYIIKYEAEKCYCADLQSVYLMSMTDNVIWWRNCTKKWIYNVLMITVLYSNIS